MARPGTIVSGKASKEGDRVGLGEGRQHFLDRQDFFSAPVQSVTTNVLMLEGDFLLRETMTCSH